MKKKFGILSILFLLLALIGAVFLVSNEQDLLNKATHYGSCNGVGQLSCTTLSGTKGGYNCSGYKSCHQPGGYDACDPIPGSNQCIYTVNGVKCLAPCPGVIPSGYMRCHCSNGVWTIGQGSSCDGLCACTNNVCENCTPTPKPPTNPPSSPTPTPTKILTPTPTPTGTLTPTPTNTPTPTPTNTPTPSNSPTTTSIPTTIPTDIPTDTPTNTIAPTKAIAEGPTPTRIVLPQSGVEFPSQMLAIFGGIIILMGFLILL